MPTTARPRVFYVSYDGVGEALGRSQVLAYLFRLTAEYEITLFSFEKHDADRTMLATELRARGIDWRPLSYHKRPPVVSTLFDVAAGCRALRDAARERQPDIVHVRSYVPALIATWARRWTAGKLLFDIRGFWADERVEGGIWPQTRTAYRLLYRVAKRYERRFFARADAIVTLTHASIPHIRALTGDRTDDIVVIPTCVDLSRFTITDSKRERPRLTWCGSVGTWYRFDLVPTLATALGLPLDVITQQTELATALLDGVPATVRSLPFDEVPDALCAGDFGISLCVSSFSKIASAPTRFAEYLAAGMPVIVNPGIGDLVAIVERHRVGVVLHGEDAAAISKVASRVQELTTDPELARRCRTVAEGLFDVDRGSRQYAELYRRLLAD